MQRHGKHHKYLVLGDSEGTITVWSIPEVSNSQLLQIKQEEFDKPPSKDNNFHIHLDYIYSIIRLYYCHY